MAVDRELKLTYNNMDFRFIIHEGKKRKGLVSHRIDALFRVKGALCNYSFLASSELMDDEKFQQYLCQEAHGAYEYALKVNSTL